MMKFLFGHAIDAIKKHFKIKNLTESVILTGGASAPLIDALCVVKFCFSIFLWVDLYNMIVFSYLYNDLLEGVRIKRRGCDFLGLILMT